MAKLRRVWSAVEDLPSGPIRRVGPVVHVIELLADLVADEELDGADAGRVDLDADEVSCSNALLDRTTLPPDQAAFREQYGMLLDGLGRRKRRVVEDLAAGGETKELAAQHNVSAGRISQIRREVEQTWKRIDRGEERGK